VLEGISRWEPRGERSEGEGALFDVEMRTLGIPLSAELELAEWVRPRRIAWRSRSGLIPQQGRWTFDGSARSTTVDLRISYEPPAAMIGTFVAGRVEGQVRARLHRALSRMKQMLEDGGE
jgi:uncharacterized membrane protein